MDMSFLNSKNFIIMLGLYRIAEEENCNKILEDIKKFIKVKIQELIAEEGE